MFSEFVLGQNAIRKRNSAALQQPRNHGCLRDVQLHCLEFLHAGEDLARRPLHRDLPLVHDVDLVGVDGLLHVVCDEQNGDPLDLVQCPCRADHFLSAARIQHRRRFVENNALRMHRDHACDGDALLLAAGEMIRALLAVFVHPDDPQALLHALPDLLRGHAEVLRTETDVLLDHLADDLIIRILKDHPGFLPHIPEMALICRVHPVDLDGASGREEQRVDMLGERGLAGSVVPEDCDKFTGLHIEIDRVQRSRPTDDVSLVVLFQIVVDQLLRNNHVFMPKAEPPQEKPFSVQQSRRCFTQNSGLSPTETPFCADQTSSIMTMSAASPFRWPILMILV